LLLFLLVLTSCEQVDLTENDTSSKDGKVNLTFTISQIETIPFDTSTRASVSDLCSRFSVALFQNGSKVKVVNQSIDDADFGTITISLAPGQYQLVAIAHNGLGNCSISSTDKVTFQNNHLSDTFYYYGSLDVTEASVTPLTLKRPVSMFRLVVTDSIPANVVQMQFYYTGGSSTFNPFSGFGCVNSRQTETFSLSGANNSSSPLGETEGGRTFEVYTFPHEANDFIDMKITALDAQGQAVAEKTLGNLYIQPNVITQHTCRFFNDSISTQASFQIEDEGRWSETILQ